MKMLLCISTNVECLRLNLTHGFNGSIKDYNVVLEVTQVTPGSYTRVTIDNVGKIVLTHVSGHLSGIDT